jgi:D-alanine-D-alanine ligase
MKLRIGYCYNLIKDFQKKVHQPKDIDAEWTTEYDVKTLHQGLVDAGFDVVDIGNPINLLEKKNINNVDIVFSIAEMDGYRYREAIASTLCELMGIPYVLSKPDVMTIALDKNICNLLVKQLGILVPDWFLVKKEKDLKKIDLSDFPYIVKPVAEGSSIGIDNDSIVYDENQAFNKAKYLLDQYNQPVLIQKFITGKEITIGVIENKSKIIALKPIEISDKISGKYSVNGVENKKQSSENEPFKLLKDVDLEAKIQCRAIAIFEYIGCRDTARIDFRVDELGNLFFIEINPLTDYTPRRDFCKSAFAFGLNYTTLLQTIILNAWENGKK